MLRERKKDLTVPRYTPVVYGEPPTSATWADWGVGDVYYRRFREYLGSVSPPDMKDVYWNLVLFSEGGFVVYIQEKKRKDE